LYIAINILVLMFKQYLNMYGIIALVLCNYIKIYIKKYKKYIYIHMAIKLSQTSVSFTGGVVRGTVRATSALQGSATDGRLQS
jgi:hypothetical protein